MIRATIIVGAVLAWTAGVFFTGKWAGRDAVTAAQVPGLIATLDAADKKAGKLQTTMDNLGRIGGAVHASVAAVTLGLDAANKRLADAGVMADCRPFTEHDVRLLNAEIDRLESAAGLAGR